MNTKWFVISYFTGTFNPPYTLSLVLPCFCSPPSGIMVTAYSPLSSSAKFLSSRDPVARSKKILRAYMGPLMLVLVEVMTLVPLKVQLTDRNGTSEALRSVVNLTVPDTAPLRGPEGKMPSPTHTPNDIENLKQDKLMIYLIKYFHLMYLIKQASNKQQSWACCRPWRTGTSVGLSLKNTESWVFWPF